MLISALRISLFGLDSDWAESVTFLFFNLRIHTNLFFKA
jgi:hypothetical protein